MKQNILNRYCILLKKAIVEMHGGDFRNSDISDETGISRNKLTDLFKNQKKDLNTLDVLSSHYKTIDYTSFSKRTEVLDFFSEKISTGSNNWTSYRLSSTRRLHIANWKLQYIKEDGSFNVTKKTHNHVFKGKMILSPDFNINITLKSEVGNDYLKYVSTVPQSLDEFFAGFQLDYILWDVLFIDGNQQYTSSEVLVREENPNLEPKHMREETIEFSGDNQSGIPTNKTYLAYNFLTRYSSKSRHYINNIKINQSPPMLYTHDVFISCPIGSLNEKKEEFTKLKGLIDKLVKILIEDFKFEPGNIYCEMFNSDYSDIGNDNRERYFNVRRNIFATHFISLIPESIEDRNSGVYLEAYFRVIKKLPAYIFYEKRRNFPSLLQGIIKDNKAVNVVFEQDFEIKEVPGYIKKRGLSMFDFGL